MNTGQTVYEQLQEILNKCIELGWKPRGYEESWIMCNKKSMKINKNTHWMHTIREFVSYHDLFSKDSGIMEFVEWKPSNDIESITINEHGGFKYGVKRSPYYEMSDMTAEMKVKFFVKNAVVPTK